MEKVEEALYNCNNEIVDCIFNKRAKEISNVKNDNEIELLQRDIDRCKTSLLCFLKENISVDHYDIAFEYVESLLDNTEKLSDYWNKKFYTIGLKDGLKMG